MLSSDELWLPAMHVVVMPGILCFRSYPERQYYLGCTGVGGLLVVPPASRLATFVCAELFGQWCTIVCVTTRTVALAPSLWRPTSTAGVHAALYIELLRITWGSRHCRPTHVHMHGNRMMYSFCMSLPPGNSCKARSPATNH